MRSPGEREGQQAAAPSFFSPAACVLPFLIVPGRPFFLTLAALRCPSALDPLSQQTTKRQRGLSPGVVCCGGSRAGGSGGADAELGCAGAKRGRERDPPIPLRSRPLFFPCSRAANAQLAPPRPEVHARTKGKRRTTRANLRAPPSSACLPSRTKAQQTPGENRAPGCCASAKRDRRWRWANNRLSFVSDRKRPKAQEPSGTGTLSFRIAHK